MPYLFRDITTKATLMIDYGKPDPNAYATANNLVNWECVKVTDAEAFALLPPDLPPKEYKSLEAKVVELDLKVKELDSKVKTLEDKVKNIEDKIK